MDFKLKQSTPAVQASERCDALIVLLPAKASKAALHPVLRAALDKATRAGDFSAGSGKTLVLYGLGDVVARRVVLVSVVEVSARHVREAVEDAMAAARSEGMRHVALDLGGVGFEAIAMQTLCQATYVYTATKPSARACALRAVTLLVADVKKSRDQFVHGEALVAGCAVMREWANRPANHATAAMLGTAAQALVKGQAAMRCAVMGPGDLARLKMGAFMAVAQGSAQEPRLIVLQYQGAPKAQPPVALVGKGITFDSGGISLKPGAGMDAMKFDMSGAACVLGVFAALALLKPRLNVVGVIAAAENLPGGTAVKPGDVVTAMDGQSVEILNTDAEGRLVLCDALTYVRRFKPQTVVDIATLTGACGVALGNVRAGLFANDEALAQALFMAGERTYDRCWRMPLDDEYAEGLKSRFADVANISERPGGGAITAAKFLQRFTTDLKWAHLDIAAVAWQQGRQKGSTTRPLALLLEWLVGEAK